MDYKITLEIYFGTQKNLVTVFIKCKGMAILQPLRDVVELLLSAHC